MNVCIVLRKTICGFQQTVDTQLVKLYY